MLRLTAATLLLLAMLPVSAAEQWASLADMTREADRIVVGEVGIMRRALERQPIAERDGRQLEGKFVFTYIEVTPQEHLLGAPTGTLTVRLLGGIHPSGRKFTSYVDAPSLATGETALLFLTKVPELGPDGEDLYSVVRHSAGKFHVSDTELGPVVSRAHPNSALAIDPREGISEAPIPLGQMRHLVQTESSRRPPPGD